MLLIRPTRSLAKRLGVKLATESEQASPSPISEWYANNFRLGRDELVLFTNPKTLFPIVIKAAPSRDLVQRFQASFSECVTRLGGSDPKELLKDALGIEVEYVKTQDRMTLGVMNEFIKELEWDFEDGVFGPDEVQKMSFLLAQRISGASRGYLIPCEAFQKELGLPVTPSRPHLRLVT